MVERHHEEVLVPGERDVPFKGVDALAVVAHHEGDVEPDPVFAEIGEGNVGASSHQVEGLAHALERVGVQRFQPNQQSLAPAFPGEAQELLVVGRVNAGLAHPLDLQGRQLTHQVLGPVDVRREVVVHEKDERLVHLPYLVDDVFRRPPGLGAAEKGLYGAELAAQVASPARLDQADGKVLLALKYRAVRPDAVEGGPGVAPVYRLHAAAPEVGNQPGPQVFCLSDDHRFGVFAHLIGGQGGVEASHDDGYATTAVLGRYLVGPLGRVSFDADSHQVGGLVVGYGLHPVVVELDLHITGSQRGEHGGSQGLHLPPPDVRFADAPAYAGVYERDSHAATAPFPTIQSQL